MLNCELFFLLLLTSGSFYFAPQAQQSLDLIQGELSKVTDNADGLIENSSLSSQRVSVSNGTWWQSFLNRCCQKDKDKAQLGINVMIDVLHAIMHNLTFQILRPLWQSTFDTSLTITWEFSILNHHFFLSHQEELERNEKMTAGLNQTVQELQLLLRDVSRQLTKDAVRSLPFALWISGYNLTRHLKSLAMFSGCRLVSVYLGFSRRLTKMCWRYSTQKTGHAAIQTARRRHHHISWQTREQAEVYC